MIALVDANEKSLNLKKIDLVQQELNEHFFMRKKGSHELDLIAEMKFKIVLSPNAFFSLRIP